MCIRDSVWVAWNAASDDGYDAGYKNGYADGFTDGVDAAAGK